MLLRLAIPISLLVATAAYADGETVWLEPAPLSIWEKVGNHWRDALPSNAGPTDSWGPLICNKPWCKDGSGFGWWHRDVAGPYNKTWPEAQRRIEEARTR